MLALVTDGHGRATEWTLLAIAPRDWVLCGAMCGGYHMVHEPDQSTLAGLQQAVSV
jgi:hypothetical protein